MVTRQIRVERRTGKVHRPKTDILPLCHATNQKITHLWFFGWFRVAWIQLEVDGICCSDATTRGATPHSRNVSVMGPLEPVNIVNTEDSCRHDGLTKSLEPLLFPDDDDTDEGQFFGEVLSAVQRWFCCSGWPNSINIVTIPDSFRRYSIFVVINLPAGAVAKYCNEYSCVCVSVCPRGYLRNHTRNLYQIYRACCLYPWLGPPALLRYVIYFQFYGWHHVFFYFGPYSGMNFATKDRLHLNLLIYHMVKSDRTDRHAVLGEDSGGPNEPFIRWGSRSPKGKGQFLRVVWAIQKH